MSNSTLASIAHGLTDAERIAFVEAATRALEEEYDAAILEAVNAILEGAS